jgi:hypothetical protein
MNSIISRDLSIYSDSHPDQDFTITNFQNDNRTVERFLSFPSNIQGEICIQLLGNADTKALQVVRRAFNTLSTQEMSGLNRQMFHKFTTSALLAFGDHRNKALRVFFSITKIQIEKQQFSDMYHEAAKANNVSLLKAMEKNDEFERCIGNIYHSALEASVKEGSLQAVKHLLSIPAKYPHVIVEDQKFCASFSQAMVLKNTQMQSLFLSSGHFREMVEKKHPFCTKLLCQAAISGAAVVVRELLHLPMLIPQDFEDIFNSAFLHNQLEILHIMKDKGLLYFISDATLITHLNEKAVYKYPKLYRFLLQMIQDISAIDEPESIKLEFLRTGANYAWHHPNSLKAYINHPFFNEAPVQDDLFIVTESDWIDFSDIIEVIQNSRCSHEKKITLMISALRMAHLNNDQKALRQFRYWPLAENVTGQQIVPPHFFKPMFRLAINNGSAAIIESLFIDRPEFADFTQKEIYEATVKLAQNPYACQRRDAVLDVLISKLSTATVGKLLKKASSIQLEILTQKIIDSNHFPHISLDMLEQSYLQAAKKESLPQLQMIARSSRGDEIKLVTKTSAFIAFCQKDHRSGIVYFLEQPSIEALFNELSTDNIEALFKKASIKKLPLLTEKLVASRRFAQISSRVLNQSYREAARQGSLPQLQMIARSSRADEIELASKTTAFIAFCGMNHQDGINFFLQGDVLRQFPRVIVEQARDIFNYRGQWNSPVMNQLRAELQRRDELAQARRRGLQVQQDRVIVPYNHLNPEA